MKTALQDLSKSISSLLNSNYLRLLFQTVPLVALLFIGYVAWQQWQTLTLTPWSTAQWLALGLAFALYAVSLSEMLWVWHRLMRVLGSPTSFRQDSRIYCLNTFSRRLPMGFVWSAGGKTLSYRELGISSTIPLSASLWEVILHTIVGLMLWLVVELSGQGFIWQVYDLVGLGVNGLTLGALLLGVLAWGGYRWWQKTMTTGLTLRWSSGEVTLWLALYLLTWLKAGFTLALLCWAFGSPLPVVQATGVWAFAGVVGYLSSIIPIINLGAKEAVLILILGQLMPASSAVLITVVFRLLFTLGDGVWPLVFWMGLRQPST